MSPARSSALARLLVAAVALGLTIPAAAQAGRLPLDPDVLRVTEAGTRNGIVNPGEAILVHQGVRSAQAGVLSGVSGTLSRTAGPVSVLEGESAFPDLAFGIAAEHLSPFRAYVSSSATCGEMLRFALSVRRGEDSITLPVAVGTGAAGPPASRDAAGLPRSIPDPGTLQSAISVAEPGRVKDVRVRIGRLDHAYTGDLRLTLVSPAGTRVRLVDDTGGDGDDLRGTILARSGLPLRSGVSPYTGTFAPVEPLSRLEGESMQGTWALEVQDESPGASGALVSWGLDLAPATCEPRPVASFTATPLPVAVGEDVTLDAASSSDPTGRIVSYAWDLDGNGSFETDGGASPQRTVRYDRRQTVEVGLRITNDLGETAQTTQSVAVTAAPVASFTASPEAPASGQSVTLDARASSDSDGTVAAYAWDLDDNGSFEAAGTSPTTTARWDVPGRRTVRLRVTDDNGATSVAAREIVVANRAPQPVVSLPAPAVAGREAVVGAGRSTDPDGTVVSYAWDLDGEPGYERSGPEGSVRHTWAAPGRFPVRVKLTDDLGATAEALGEVVVTAPPHAALTATPAAVRPQTPVTLDASASADPDGALAAVAWDLDGVPGFEATGGTALRREVAFATPGRRTVRVRVTDEAGATATAAAEVDVVNLAPQARLTASANPVAVGDALTLDASGSSDAEGPVARYAWDLDGNGSFETDGGTAPTLSRAYPNPASIAVAVRVTDQDGAVASASLPLRVVMPSALVPAPAPGPAAGPDPAPGPAPAGPRAPEAPAPGAAAAAPPGAGGAAGEPGAPPDAVFSAGLTGAPIQRLAAVARAGVAVGCTADRAAGCVVVLELQPAEARRLRLVPAARRGARAKPYRIGTLRLTAAPGRPATGSVRVPARVRGALARTRGATVVVRATAAPSAGGAQLALTRLILLRR